MIAMEAITAFVEGPGCFAVVYGMLTRRPWVFTAQILVSIGQIYGDVLYFGTSILEGEAPRALPDWSINFTASFIPDPCAQCLFRPSLDRLPAQICRFFVRISGYFAKQLPLGIMLQA